MLLGVQVKRCPSLSSTRGDDSVAEGVTFKHDCFICFLLRLFGAILKNTAIFDKNLCFRLLWWKRDKHKMQPEGALCNFSTLCFPQTQTNSNSLIHASEPKP